MAMEESSIADYGALTAEDEGDDLAELEQCDHEISRLQLQLTRYEARRQGILERAQSSQKPPCSIQGLPDELLLAIFEDRLWWDHARILDLLSVCQRWYILVLHSAKLWSRIHVKPKFPDTEDFNWSAYVTTCLSRSLDIPLHVCIDLTYVWSRRGFFSKVIADAVHEYVDHRSHSEIVRRLNFENLLLPSTRYDTFHERAIAAVGDAAGHDGAHLSRWRTLCIKFPIGAFITEELTWRQLAGRASGMNELTVVNLAGANSSMVHFPNLHRLFLTTEEDAHPDIGDISFLDIHESSLRHLEYQISTRWDNLGSLENFANLETLKLHRPDIGKMTFLASPRHLTNLSIHLPHLHTLILSGALGFLSLVTLDLPSLQYLDFIRHSPKQPTVMKKLPSQPANSTVPRVTPVHVTWVVMHEYRHSWNEAALKTALQEVLEQYLEAETIKVADFTRGVVEDILEGSAGGKAQVIFVPDTDAGP